MTIGENIKHIRLKKKMTQKQLGELCGMADSAIRRYELGNANPKIATVKRIADALEVPLNEIVGNDYYSLHSDPYFIKTDDPKRAIEILDNMYNMWEKSGFSASNPPKNDDDRKKVVQVAKKEKLLTTFNSLNFHGQNKAIEQVDMISKIPEYQKDYSKED